MTDEEYVYRSDIKEKSKTARSAHNAYSARRRGCRMSTDRMSKKEWESMNGPIHTVNLGESMSWEEFKNKPESLQKQYINDILSKYSVGPAALARMFGISGQYCGTYLRKLGYTFKSRAKIGEAERFLTDFMGQPNETTGCETIIPEPSEDMPIEKVVISFVGAFTPEAIAAKLASLFPKGQEVAVTVEVAKVAKF